MNALRYRVTGQTLRKLVDTNEVIANTKGIYKVEFIFDTSWDGLTKQAIFENRVAMRVDLAIEPGTNEEEIIYSCEIPEQLLLQQGDLKIGCVGFDEHINRRYPTGASEKIKIAASISIDVQDISVPKTLAEELQEKMKELQKEMEELAMTVRAGGVYDTKVFQFRGTSKSIKPTQLTEDISLYCEYWEMDTNVYYYLATQVDWVPCGMSLEDYQKQMKLLEEGAISQVDWFSVARSANQEVQGGEI